MDNRCHASSSHKYVWLYTEYMPTLHWRTGASYISPYVITVTWRMSSDIIIHHRSNAYESFPTGPCYVTLPLLLSLLLLLPLPLSVLLLLPLLLLLSHHFATDTLLQILSLSGVVELKTQLLILENILWLPLVSNQQIGLNTLPSKTFTIPYTCGLSITSTVS